MRRLIVDSWFGARPERATWRPKKREAALSPAICQKKAFREEAQRQKEQVLVSGSILDRWIKGQKVWAKWPGNGEEYQGTVEAISGNQLRIVWNDGDKPTWVDIKDVWPKHYSNSTAREARVIEDIEAKRLEAEGCRGLDKIIKKVRNKRQARPVRMAAEKVPKHQRKLQRKREMKEALRREFDWVLLQNKGD